MNDTEECVLVTGGTGSLGRGFVALLQEKGIPVRVLSRKQASFSSPHIQAVLGDLGQPEILRSAVSGCRAVFHFAAELREEERMTAVNVEGTRNLINAAIEAGVPFFCHLSSVGVVGSTSHKRVDEISECHPVNPYEVSKQLAEEIVIQAKGGCMRKAILRPTNVFGQDSVATILNAGGVYKLKSWVKARENAHWVYVRDVAASTWHVWRHPSATECEVYNVSSDGEPGNTVGEIVDTVWRLGGLGKRLPPLSPPWQIARFLRGFTVGHANRGDMVFEGKKLREAGFMHPFGLAGGIRDCIQQLAGNS